MGSGHEAGTRIVLVRGERVLLDADLALLYGVPVKAINQAVRRNPGRFPEDFSFRLSEDERKEVVTNCDHLARLKFSAATPVAFTEQGVAMLSSVLRSPRAVRVNVEIMRAFVRLRRIMGEHAELRRRLDDLESKYDGQFGLVFEAIRELMELSDEDETAKPRIGFRAD